MSASKAKVSTTTQLVVGLIVLTILYQVAYQSVMYRALPAPSSLDDEHCKADSQSLQCAEVQLFRSWKQASSTGSLDGDVDAESDRDLEMLAIDTTKGHKMLRKSTSAAAQSGQSDMAKLDGGAKDPPAVSDPLEEVKSDFDRLYEETYAKLHEETSYASPLAQDFEDLKSRYKEHKQKLHDIHAAHHHAHQSTPTSPPETIDKFEKLYQDSMAAMASHDHDPLPFADGLAALRASLEARKQSLEARHLRGHDRTTTTAAPLHEQTLMEKIQAVGHDLCELPEHRKMASCAQFLASAEVAKEDDGHVFETAAKHSLRAAIRKPLASDVALEAQLAEFDHHLCADSRHNTSAHCRELLASGKLGETIVAAPAESSAAASPAQAPKNFLGAVSANDLQWSKVTALEVASRLSFDRRHGASGKLFSFDRDELRHLRFSSRWGEKIPKVACVSPIPSTAGARAHIRYLVDNFKLQHYEGEKELILVYRHKDKQIEEIVKEQDNGKDVRAVAVFEDGEFPSTTAFRFAAWSAHDADIVARWNHDEWYSPDRLSLQVRAMAHSGRPVSLLKFWTVLAGSGKELMSTRGGPGWEGSIVGEARWMREHWMPLIEGERADLMDHYKQDIVQVSQPDLLIFNAEAVDSPDTSRHFGLKWRPI